jgi:hypothetical protein
MLLPRAPLLLLALLLVAASPGRAKARGSVAARRCRKAKDCESCTSTAGLCGWCDDRETQGRCLVTPLATPLGGLAAGECGGTVQASCLGVDDPTRDSDHVSQTINRAVPPKSYAEATEENGRKIALALDLRRHMQRVVDAHPGAHFISSDPPIIQFENFLGDEECDALQAMGEPGLQPSLGALNTEKLEQKKHAGRTSHNAMCKAACRENPAVKRISARIANVTGLSIRNMEPYQFLRYTGSQEYQAHSDFIPQQAGDRDAEVEVQRGQLTSLAAPCLPSCISSILNILSAFLLC